MVDSVKRVKTVDWSKWSAIAEIFGAIAIVVTLLYLAIQTQQNTQAIEASAARDVARDEGAAISAIVADPEIFLLFDRHELTEADAVKLHGFLSVFTRAQENYWTQYGLGVIEEGRLLRYQRSFSMMLSNERARNWWNVQKVAFDPGFAERIDSILREQPLRPVGTMGPALIGLFEGQP